MSDDDAYEGAFPNIPLSEVSAEQLLIICADSGNAPAWDEFMKRFHELIISIARRTASHYTEASVALCNDLAQEVYLKLNAKNRRLLREFVPRHDGAAYGYLSVVTQTVVHDYFKGKGRPRREEELPPDVPAPLPDPIRRILIREIDDFLRRNTSETNRQIFWFHHKYRFTAKQIASLPHIRLSESGVEAVLHRLRLLIRAAFAWPNQTSKLSI
jgi:DNA-directed RNA polymerase specialized sigma24 family protein